MKFYNKKRHTISKITLSINIILVTILLVFSENLLLLPTLLLLITNFISDNQIAECEKFIDFQNVIIDLQIKED